MVSNTWKPDVWCVQYHSMYFFPAITMSRPVVSSERERVHDVHTQRYNRIFPIAVNPTFYGTWIEWSVCMCKSKSVSLHPVSFQVESLLCLRGPGPCSSNFSQSPHWPTDQAHWQTSNLLLTHINTHIQTPHMYAHTFIYSTNTLIHVHIQRVWTLARTHTHTHTHTHTLKHKLTH